MIALGVILTVFFPTCLTLGGYCIIRYSLRCLRHSGRGRPPSPFRLRALRLPHAAKLSIIASYTCHLGARARGFSWWMALLCLFGREEVIRPGLYSWLVVEYCRWMKKTIFVTMNLMRVTRSAASVVCDCWMRSFWSTPEARVHSTLA